MECSGGPSLSEVVAGGGQSDRIGTIGICGSIEDPLTHLEVDCSAGYACNAVLFIHMTVHRTLGIDAHLVGIGKRRLQAVCLIPGAYFVVIGGIGGSVVAIYEACLTIFFGVGVAVEMEVLAPFVPLVDFVKGHGVVSFGFVPDEVEVIPVTKHALFEGTEIGGRIREQHGVDADAERIASGGGHQVIGVGCHGYIRSGIGVGVVLIGAAQALEAFRIKGQLAVVARDVGAEQDVVVESQLIHHVVAVRKVGIG